MSNSFENWASSPEPTDHNTQRTGSVPPSAGRPRLIICPHLGLYDDPSLSLTEVSHDHRCFAQSQPVVPHLDHQYTYCLTGSHTQCRLYYAKQWATSWSDTPESPAAQPPASSHTQPGYSSSAYLPPAEAPSSYTPPAYSYDEPVPPSVQPAEQEGSAYVDSAPYVPQEPNPANAPSAPYPTASTRTPQTIWNTPSSSYSPIEPPEDFTLVAPNEENEAGGWWRRALWFLGTIGLLLAGLLLGQYLSGLSFLQGVRTDILPSAATLTPEALQTPTLSSIGGNGIQSSSGTAINMTESVITPSLIPPATSTPEETQTPIQANGTALAAPINTSIPLLDSQALSITPKLGDVGWWRSNEPNLNHLNDSFLYAGRDQGEIFTSLIRLDLSDVARGAPIDSGTFRLTGLRTERLNPTVPANWSVQLIAEKELPSFAVADFLTVYSAPAAIMINPALKTSELAVDQANLWQLDSTALDWIEQQRIAGATALFVRLTATFGEEASGTAESEQSSSLFAWDSGLGAESHQILPSLLLQVGPAPMTPPALPVESTLVATLTPTPENIITLAAESHTATVVALTTGTYTPQPPVITPIAENLATAQAIAASYHYPPVILPTATPQNEATVIANVFHATIIAATTGTYTPMPPVWVTPILVIPSPPAENVATVAAQAATATDVATQTVESPTPLPYNAVLAHYVYATPTSSTQTPANESDATTPLPWNYIVITPVPTVSQ